MNFDAKKKQIITATVDKSVCLVVVINWFVISMLCI